MSETSTPYTPASTSTSVAGNETVALADEIKKYKTEALIDFLRKEEDLGLNDDDFEIIRKRKIMGRDFLKTSKEEFEHCGLEMGPAKRLADFAKECKDKKLKAFSSYLSLSEVLAEYGLDSDGIDSIPLFSPPTYEIQDSNKVALHGRDFGQYGTLQPDSLEAMRNEYVVALLHASIHIVMDITDKELSMRPQYGIVGEESRGRVDFAIKEAEDLICITEDKQHKVPVGIAQNIKQLKSACETNKRKRKRGDDDFDYLYGIVTTGRDWHFLLYSPGKIYKASDTAYSIEFIKKALDPNSEEYQSLCKNVRKVLGIIVGLLKDRACAEEEPERKRVRIEGYRSKK
ncbi:hypothetical protein GLOIN_2v1695250 [Rhizophagus irregularis DAOM 181602=DAOM 197198]|uniref:SAM domain-containing protein n=1 Tax=Rhizophagus irregularis (strain DAOM 181602 / DAOM 197198 / MUCL 43194) TaxID=747089 RepID=A0A2H5RB06_RHIID|nr:hypothetical protein GLOIN_2v1695250 [Rhizophagus irregularis DAOM 181602=DAOM 197198]POG62532.1 hypothetical protein GLOIN_2v1695250 [Rhizophagus irregularis DAOM 181602=DAOM 197198]GBC14895.1 hypothetical protein GLOIN_2v1695250 [Rhizophagus irregularis DAOM 181602=DAOM 197198]|eukprot:XP_025169398.1 hypothetical protein GLOIN_2v1695250 [Rhizophagus irregularis DAOM 181602=DAOM 197198]